jgi:hypothetical protein
MFLVVFSVMLWGFGLYYGAYLRRWGSFAAARIMLVIALIAAAALIVAWTPLNADANVYEQIMATIMFGTLAIFGVTLYLKFHSKYRKLVYGPIDSDAKRKEVP